jgi:sugar-specific transcriptional regulator TrmB
MLRRVDANHFCYDINDMADFLEEKKREIDKRLKELRPLVDEFHRLEAAAAALEGVPGATGNAAAARTPARRTRRARKATSARSAPRGRPRGSGARSKQVLELVVSRPGITIPEIAQAIGIQQNYLYRVLPALQKDGLVRKEGRGWHPREAT